MSRVIPLPGAAIAPVVQPVRRGRFPKTVISNWRLTRLRFNRHSEAASIAHEMQMARECEAVALEMLALQRRKIASIEQRAQALSLLAKGRA